jgi:hypothetical protein
MPLLVVCAAKAELDEGIFTFDIATFVDVCSARPPTDQPITVVAANVMKYRVSCPLLEFEMDHSDSTSGYWKGSQRCRLWVIRCERDRPTEMTVLPKEQESEILVRIPRRKVRKYGFWFLQDNSDRSDRLLWLGSSP